MKTLGFPCHMMIHVCTYGLRRRAGRENVWLEPVMTYGTNAAGPVLHDWEPNTFPSGRT